MGGLGRRLAPWGRWVIFGSTVFFLVHALGTHWQEFQNTHLQPASWRQVLLALGFTLGAHSWAGWVWQLTLQQLGYRVPVLWAIRVYLKTNSAKYLPGNIWHFYGRVRAVQRTGASLGLGVVSVLLEPLLMALAALGWGSLGSPSPWQQLSWAGLGVGLMLIHPRFLNPLLLFWSRAKAKLLAQEAGLEVVKLQRYPWALIAGEGVFLTLRGTAFALALAVFTPVALWDLPWAYSGFALAWLVGLIVPGAPAGLGVFELTAVVLLSGLCPFNDLLSAILCYRFISIVAEALGASWAWITEPKTAVR